MKLRAVVVYESMWGNTARIARAIAEGIGSDLDVHLVDVSHAPPAPGPAIALLVVGGPTHAFSMSRANTRADARRQGAPEPRGQDIGLRDWISALPEPPHGQQLVTFDTRVGRVRHLPGSAAKAAARLAHARGYPRFAPSESFYVNDVSGPLLDGETTRANHWGHQLAAQLVAAA